MGVFDCECVESGLYIDDKQWLVPIVASRPLASGVSREETPVYLSAMPWEALALPIAGSYNSYGTMEDPDELDANMRAVQEFGAYIKLRNDDASGYSLGEILEEIRADGPGGWWNDRQVSFALIEDGIYRSIVDVVAANGTTAWRRFAAFREADTDPTMRRLVDSLRTDPDDEAVRRVYLDALLEREDPRGKLIAVLPAIETQPVDALASLVLPHAGVIYRDTKLADLRSALVDFVRFRAWGTDLKLTFGGAQFDGYGGENTGLDLARAKYAEMPELLTVVEANDERWRKRLD